MQHRVIGKPLIAHLLHLADRKKRGSSEESPIFICAGMQQDLGLSNSQTKILLSNFRLATGSQKVIDKNAFILYTDPGEKIIN